MGSTPTCLPAPGDQDTQMGLSQLGSRGQLTLGKLPSLDHGASATGALQTSIYENTANTKANIQHTGQLSSDQSEVPSD